MDFNFPTPAEIQQEQDRRRANGQAVRLLADDSDKPEAGKFYTVTPSFSGGDGSWSECFWEVLTLNGPKAFVRIHQRSGDPIERFWDINDRAWYLANDAWALANAGGPSK